jgi:hypothetical protein
LKGINQLAAGRGRGERHPAIRRRIAGLAAELTGIKEKTSLVRLGLEALIARESAKRLAALGGTEQNLKMIPRRRMEEH